MSAPAAPPPVRLGDRTIVAPDVVAIDATLRFDTVARAAHARAQVSFLMEAVGGFPALDLRQPIDELRLDGRLLDGDAFPHLDLGAGDDARMRVLDVECRAGSRHVLEVGYHLGTPDATGAVPIGWEDGGVRFDLWMSDLEPGRYLEMWLPAPLCHDRFALRVELAVTGTDRAHVARSNAHDDEPVGPNQWQLRYPASCTSLSPMLVLAPADCVEDWSGEASLPGRRSPLSLRVSRHREVDADLVSIGEDVTAWLVYLAARYGPWAHGDRFSAVVWGAHRGMEYDGATTSSVDALEHEVFHSWFGRGVKPARASDGWIDEAWTSWATATHRHRAGRFAVEPLPEDTPPVLLCPPHPWSRATPRESYGEGAAVFAAVAHALGGADRLRSAMAAWYAANAGGASDTEDLQASLEQWSGLGLGSLFDRYVHGRG
jgi:hypothetical protein